MDGNEQMNTRATDHFEATPDQQGGVVKITREIPLWGILSVVGALAAQAISVYYGQVRLAENVERLSIEVRSFTTEVNSLNRAQVAFEVRLQMLERQMAERLATPQVRR